jgi:hypothetical protein
VKLRKFVKESDHLSGAVFSTITKLSAIPLRIVPRDLSIKTHVYWLINIPIILKIFQISVWDGNLYSKFLEDFYTQDNGAFAEVIGDGKRDERLLVYRML